MTPPPAPEDQLPLPEPSSAAPQPEEAEDPNDSEDASAETEAAETEPTDASADLKPEDQLLALVNAGKSARLSPADEEHAIQLLKQTVVAGPKALPATLEAILALPWSVGVKAVTEAWPNTKPAGRTRLLNGLAKLDSDISRRIRLSLARGLHAQDPASTLKLLLGVCEAMGGTEGGSSAKDRQIFANVMLGKARPWIMNIPMAEMKPAEAHKLITPALEACSQSPVFTQIWVLRWICDAGKFDTLPAEHVEAICKSLSRWQPRWKKELRKIIPKLPEPIEQLLGDTPAPAPAHAPTSAHAPSSAPAPAPVFDESDATAPLQAFLASDPTRAPAQPEPNEPSSSSESGPSGEGHPAEPRAPAHSRQPEVQHRGRPQSGPFDLTRSLREIESYVVRLRSELQQAQVASRRREPERHRTRVQPSGSPEELDELRRHNQQLEEQNEDLRRRIEELASDHEDRAATLEINDTLEQFKSYLGLRLKEDFADYNAISRESLNEVVRRHAFEILGRIFSLLQSEGVRFDREG